MFARLGRWCYHHRIAVVVGWLVVLVIGGALSAGMGTAYRSQFTLPDTESKRGFDVINQAFGGQGGGQQGSIVFRAQSGVNDPAVKQAMTAMFDKVAQIPNVRLTSPYSQAGAQQISQRGADAGKVAFATVEVPRSIKLTDATHIAKQIKDLKPQQAGLQVYLGGRIFGDFKPPSSELLGLAFAIVILILAFGSVMAMGLPVGVALAGIGLGTVIVGFLSHVITMPDFTTTVGIMIGLGVGIDYSLFIVTRYREQRHKGYATDSSIATALDTAGRAVTFAGTAVVISLLGMVVMGVGFVTGLAVGAAVTVAVTLVASITLLPALLGLVGGRIERTRWRGLIAAGLVAIALFGAGLKVDPLLVGLPLAAIVLVASFAVAPLRREVPRRPPKPVRETLAYRWSRVIQHRPWWAVAAGVIILVTLALPVLGLHLGFSDEGNYPAKTDTRKAYDLLAQGFGPGFNGPLVLVAKLPGGSADQAVVQQVTNAVKATPGIAQASPGVLDDKANPTAVLWRVIPTTSPQAADTNKLVHHLRSDVLPTATQGSGVHVDVTGSVAANIDFSDYLASRLPWFFAVVLGLSFLLLMTVFRSLLVPLKAVVMNLLSIGAAYGLVTLIFQWGWGKGLIGIETAPIEPFVPMMMFAIVFGLSMDYEVFLLSRIKEEYDRTGNSRESVADGLAATARVITAAAAIMVFVFGSFLLDNERVIKLFGIGLASAVFLDATVVRMLLVPATMELLGDKNWWLPRWLDRILPRIDVEGHISDEELELEAEKEPVTA